MTLFVRMMSMKKCIRLPVVRVSNLQSKHSIRVTQIQKLTETILKVLRQRKELHVAMVSDSQIKKINKTFHAQNKPTDVLAFEAPRFSAPNFLGEVIVSVDRARVYSKRFQATHDEELMRYVIHGMLHLLGERDHKESVRKKMFEKQERLLKLISPIPKLVVRKT